MLARHHHSSHHPLVDQVANKIELCNEASEITIMVIFGLQDIIQRCLSLFIVIRSYGIMEESKESTLMLVGDRGEEIGRC